MQCAAPCGSDPTNFSCLTAALFPNPSTAVWDDEPIVSGGGGGKKGFLSTPSDRNGPNPWMTFEQLNNPLERKSWLDNAYSALITAGVIPAIPNLNNVNGNLSGAVDLSPYIDKISTLESNLNSEYCFYQKRYYVAVSMFLNNYKDASAGGNAEINVSDQQAALTCNNKVNTLIAWMNYLSEKQILNLRSLQSQIGEFDQSIKKSSDDLMAQAKMLQDNTNSSQLYQEMVKFTTEKNQAHQNLLALYFTLNVVAIASLFVLARVL